MLHSREKKLSCEALTWQFSLRLRAPKQAISNLNKRRSFVTNVRQMFHEIWNNDKYINISYGEQNALQSNISKCTGYACNSETESEGEG